MSIYLHYHLSIEDAIVAGVTRAGSDWYSLTTSDVQRLGHDRALLEAAQPYLESHTDYVDIPTLPLRTDYLPEGMFEALELRKERIHRARAMVQTAKGLLDAGKAWSYADIESFARFSEESPLQIADPPEDLRAPELGPDGTVALALSRWAHDLVLAVASFAARDRGAGGQDPCHTLAGLLGSEIPPSVRRLLTKANQPDAMLACIPDDIQVQLLEIREEKNREAQERAARVGRQRQATEDMIRRVGLPGQAERFLAGVLPDAELDALEERDAFEGIWRPHLAAVQRVSVAQDAEIPEPQDPPGFLITSAWNSPTAVDPELWELGRTLRVQAQHSDGRLRVISHRAARGTMPARSLPRYLAAGCQMRVPAIARVVLMQARSCLGNWVTRQYAWVTPETAPPKPQDPPPAFLIYGYWPDNGSAWPARMNEARWHVLERFLSDHQISGLSLYPCVDRNATPMPAGPLGTIDLGRGLKEPIEAFASECLRRDPSVDTLRFQARGFNATGPVVIPWQPKANEGTPTYTFLLIVDRVVTPWSDSPSVNRQE